MSIDFHRLVRPIDINRLIFIDYYRLYRLISDDRLSSIGHAGNSITNNKLMNKTISGTYGQCGDWQPG